MNDIKFETINNTLCRMVEPEPLTDTSTFPCVVRLIQNDTMLGKANKRACHPETLANKRICVELTDDGMFMDGNYTYRYEIIGYPVEEGSHWWALWQMRNGNAVCHTKAPSIKYSMPTHYVKRKVRENCTDDMSIQVWLSGADETGWQLHAPQPNPQFKAVS